MGFQREVIADCRPKSDRAPIFFSGMWFETALGRNETGLGAVSLRAQLGKSARLGFTIGVCRHPAARRRRGGASGEIHDG